MHVKAKVLRRRHLYAEGDLIQANVQFKAKALPEFYGQRQETNDQ
jgi:hypothetical protein